MADEEAKASNIVEEVEEGDDEEVVQGGEDHTDVPALALTPGPHP